MRNENNIIKSVQRLIQAYNMGLLGGERMPEHENPNLKISSKENYMYFTLPMALNYQRDSYALWKCANKMYSEFPNIFDSHMVCAMEPEEIKNILVRYKVALQPNKQPVIWSTLCRTIEQDFAGDIRNLFSAMEYKVSSIKDYIQGNKKKFPYLGGNKICNYWLYVMEQYTDVKFQDRENITVAPDTHVIQASTKLGLITEKEAQQAGAQTLVTERWERVLARTDIAPIDIHTPMWLWSRGKFQVSLEK